MKTTKFSKSEAIQFIHRAIAQGFKRAVRASTAPAGPPLVCRMPDGWKSVQVCLTRNRYGQPDTIEISFQP